MLDENEACIVWEILILYWLYKYPERFAGYWGSNNNWYPPTFNHYQGTEAYKGIQFFSIQSVV